MNTVWRKTIVPLVGAIFVTVLLSACGGKSGGSEGPAAQNPPTAEPVTLKFYLNTVLDDFEKYVNQYVKKKFPHVTLEVVENKQGSKIQDLIAANDIPDIIWEGLTNLGGGLTELDVPMDLTPLAKKHGFDFSKYDAKIVDSIKSYSPKGEILYLPYNVLVFATHYNKDIFDKFGVAYPKDNMTWEELAELGKRITRKDGEQQYIGLKPPLNVNRLQTQLSLSYVDAGKEKAALNNDGWKRFFETMKSISLLTDQFPIKSFGDARTEFLNKRTLGIWPDILQLQNSDMVALEKEGLRWDIVTYPVFKDRPGIGVGVFSDGFVIPKGSKHPDLAFQIIAYLSTDPEVQLGATKDGRITALNDAKILEHAFENNEAAKGKNLKAAFSLKYPEPPIASRYDATGRNIINRKAIDYVNNTKDVNTLMREAEEELNKSIAEMNAR